MIQIQHERQKKEKEKEEDNCVGESKRSDRGSLSLRLIIKMLLETENT